MHISSYLKPDTSRSLRLPSLFINIPRITPLLLLFSRIPYSTPLLAQLPHSDHQQPR